MHSSTHVCSVPAQRIQQSRRLQKHKHRVTAWMRERIESEGRVFSAPLHHRVPQTPSKVEWRRPPGTPQRVQVILLIYTSLMGEGLYWSLESVWTKCNEWGGVNGQCGSCALLLKALSTRKSPDIFIIFIWSFFLINLLQAGEVHIFSVAQRSAEEAKSQSQERNSQLLWSSTSNFSFCRCVAMQSRNCEGGTSSRQLHRHNPS